MYLDEYGLCSLLYVQNAVHIKPWLATAPAGMDRGLPGARQDRARRRPLLVGERVLSLRQLCAAPHGCGRRRRADAACHAAVSVSESRADPGCASRYSMVGLKAPMEFEVFFRRRAGLGRYPHAAGGRTDWLELSIDRGVACRSSRRPEIPHGDDADRSPQACRVPLPEKENPRRKTGLHSGEWRYAGMDVTSAKDFSVSRVAVLASATLASQSRSAER